MPSKKRKWKKKDLKKYFFILPAFIVIIGLIGYPLVRAIVVSFYDYNPLKRSMNFNGLTNYIAIFKDPLFYKSLKNSAIWTFGVVFFQFSLGLMGAVLLNQKFRGRGIARALVLIPWATPSVIAGLMWMWILDANFGVVNDILKRLNIIEVGIPWFSDSTTALPSLMLIDIWIGVPFFAIMILAALQTVPNDLLQAAHLDGANVWKVFWKITFPLILPTVLVTILLRTIWTSSFMDLVLIITKGGPGFATTLLPFYAYNKAYFTLDYGGATALAVIQSLLLLVIVLIYARLSANTERSGS